MKAPKKVRGQKKKDLDKDYNGGSKITDFFAVRRSGRRTAKELELERIDNFTTLIKTDCTDG